MFLMEAWATPLRFLWFEQNSKVKHTCCSRFVHCVHPRHPKPPGFCKGASDTYCSCWSVKWPGSWSQSPKGPYLSGLPQPAIPQAQHLARQNFAERQKIRRHHHHHHQHHHHHHHHHPTFTCSSVSAIFSEAVGSDYLIRVSHGSRLGLPTLVVTANRSPEVLSAGIVFPRRPVGWPILKRPRSNATRPTH